MSFRKWLSDKVSAPKTQVELSLETNKHLLGEPLRGKVKITSEEEFEVAQVAVVLTCNESIKKTRTYSSQYGTQQSEYWDSGEIFRTQHVIFESAHIPAGFSTAYPFQLSVPTAAKETCYGVDKYVKWYLYPIFDIKGRPDIPLTTYEVLIERQQTQQQPSQPIVKEVVKEIVLIPCGYCGSLMPQTAVFCPNCGARRKT